MPAPDFIRPELEWTVHLAARHDATRPRASLVTGQLLIEVCRSLVREGVWPGEIVDRT